MDEKEFIQMCKEISKRESVLDGNCKEVTVIGMCHKDMLEQMGMLRYAGKKKSRFVIEYDAETGTGWRRFVREL